MADALLKLETLDQRTAFRPGEVIEGVAGWELPESAEQVEVHLCWHTEGRGTEDAAVVDKVVFADPPSTDAQLFQFTAPNGPYSFAGQLVAICWTLELFVAGSKRAERLDITISPSGEAMAGH